MVLTILKWIGFILAFFAGVVLILFIIYKVLNKDPDISFSEYVTKITSFSKENTTEIKRDTSSDILDVLSAENPEISDIFSSDTARDPLADTPKKITPPIKQEVKQVKQEVKSDVSEVPDWLKGNFDTEKKEKILPPEKEGNKTTSKPLPINNNTSQKKEITPEKNKETEVPVKENNNFDIEKETQLVAESNVPDWLKGSFDAPTTVENSSLEKETPPNREKQSEAPAPSINVSSSGATLNAKQEVNVPDWLKESMQTPSTSETPKVSSEVKQAPEETDKNTKQDTANVAIKPEVTKKTTTPVAPKTQTPVSKESEVIPPEAPKKKSPAKKVSSVETPDTPKKSDNTASDTQTKNDELWDDGMKIPDWLKSDE